MLERRWKGRYFDGETSRVHPAEVYVSTTGLEVSIGGMPSGLWKYQEIRQTQGYTPAEQVRFERGEQPAESVIVEDQGILNAIHSVAPFLESRVDRPEYRKRRFRLAVLGLLLILPMVALAYHYGMPSVAERVALRVPVSWEQRLGRSVVSALAPEGLRISDAACTEPVNRILETLTSRLPETPYTFHVTLVDQKMVNAFAAPGGHIVVFTGLINAAETPEELAGVLAHEIQHVVNRHSTKAMIRGLAVSLILGAVTGGTEGVGQILDTAAGELAGLTYQRQEEEEADREGMELLRRARVDPNGMIRFFESLEKIQGVMSHLPSFLSTHPDTQSRIEDLRQLAGEAGYEPVTLLTDQEWAALKEACGG